MSRGIVVLAVNSEQVNYLNCAYTLAENLKSIMPNIPVSLLTDKECEAKKFDDVIILPYGDLSGFENDWQVYEASPYTETIKIEADMFIPRSIEHWFNILSIQDVAVCTKIRNHKSEISQSRFYRKFIDDNKLPDVYNALTYFKKSETAEQFFNVVKNIFENWDEFKATLKCNLDEQASTDWVYAIACHIIGKEKTTIPCFDEFSMVHMKSMILEINPEDWTDALVYECLPDVIRIQTFAQIYPLHYHVKTFCNKIQKGVFNGTTH